MSWFSKAGRWFDKKVLQTTPGQIGLGLATGGLSVLPGLAYNLLRSQTPGAPDLGTPPVLPDLTDQAIQIARDRAARMNRAGGTNSSFLSGVLGPMQQPSTFVKSLLGS